MTKEAEKLNEEQRKLQVTGGSTFILSLPKDWATKNELKRGSSMMVREEDDGSLSIAPSSFPKKEKQDEAFIKVSQNDNPDAVMRTAISAYLRWLQHSAYQSARAKSAILKTPKPPQKLRQKLLGWNRNCY